MAAYEPEAVFQLTRDDNHPKGDKVRSVNCNPTAAATLVDFVTCGTRTTTGAAVRALTGDFEGGTTIRQVARAVQKGFKVDLDSSSGAFLRVVEALEEGRGVSLCGSSIATFGTKFAASKRFKGNHQWALTDIRELPGGKKEILVFDPLADGRAKGISTAPQWMPLETVKSFAGNLDIRSKAQVDAKVPPIRLGIGKATYAVTEVNHCQAGKHNGNGQLPAVQLRKGAIPFGGPDGDELEVRVDVARVRRRPHLGDNVVGRKRKGEIFLAFQKIRGQEVNESHLWFGDRLGSRWMPFSAFQLGAHPGPAPVDDDPETVNLPAAIEVPDADDVVIEGVESAIDEDEIVELVPA